MNKNKQDELRSIQINRYINCIVLLATLLNFVALDIRQKNIINNINNNTPKKIFIVVLLLGVVSNLIIFSRNLKELKENNNNFIYKIRQLANTLVLIALVLIIYFETQENDNTDSPFV
jgi:cell division protein FtsW (lipid II flippase)